MKKTISVVMLVVLALSFATMANASEAPYEAQLALVKAAAHYGGPQQAQGFMAVYTAAHGEEAAKTMRKDLAAQDAPANVAVKVTASVPKPVPGPKTVAEKWAEMLAENPDQRENVSWDDGKSLFANVATLEASKGESYYGLLNEGYVWYGNAIYQYSNPNLSEALYGSQTIRGRTTWDNAIAGDHAYDWSLDLFYSVN